MRTIRQDLRFAFRMLLRKPAFTAVAVLSLALAIGASTTIYTWMSALLFRPLGHAVDTGRLMKVGSDGSQSSVDLFALSYAEYLDLRRRSTQLSGILAHSNWPMNLARRDGAERVWSSIVSRNYFEVLGVPAAVGRTFVADEDFASVAGSEVVLSFALWQRAFGGDEAIVGRTIRLNRRPFTVVGVTPQGFRGGWPGLDLDLWVPINTQEVSAFTGYPVDASHRYPRWLDATARVAGEVEPKAAEAELRTIVHQLNDEYPQARRGYDPALYPLWRAPDTPGEACGPALFALGGLAVVVLLIACANVANLLLVRAAARRHEIAVRAAVGAGRARLVRQLLTESLVLALVAGTAGWVFTLWGSDIVAAFVPAAGIPLAVHVEVDWRAFGVILALTLASSVLFGLAPALRSSRVDIAEVFKGAGRTASPGQARVRLRDLLVVVQVSLSLLLLVCAMLFLRSFHKARSADPGFSPNHVLLAAVDLRSEDYDHEDGARFWRELLGRLETLPGVDAVSLGVNPPLGFNKTGESSFLVEGIEPDPDPTKRPFSRLEWVGPSYFRTMEIPLAAGRDFTPADDGEAQPAVIINATLAERYWPRQDPVGKRLNLSGTWRTIIGVAANSKFRRLSETAVPYMFIPVLQDHIPTMTIHLRSAQDPRLLAVAVRREVASINRGVGVYEVRTLAAHMGAQTVGHRLASSLAGFFGLVTLLLATGGLYAVLAQSVTQRTHELGVRVAFGAQPRDVVTLVLGRALVLCGIGLAVGCGAALGVTHLLRSLLFGISAVDPASFAFALGFLVLAAVIASALPAERAAAVDPAETLRCA